MEAKVTFFLNNIIIQQIILQESLVLTSQIYNFHIGKICDSKTDFSPTTPWRPNSKL